MDNILLEFAKYFFQCYENSISKKVDVRHRLLKLSWNGIIIHFGNKVRKKSRRLV